VTTAITKLPFFGGTLSGFDPHDTATTESTSGGTYDSTYATCSLAVGPGSYALSPTWTAASTFWLRFFYMTGNPISGFPTYTIVSLLHGGVVVYALQAAYAGGLTYNWNLYKVTGGVTFTLVNSFNRGASLNPFDINIVSNVVGGTAAMYSNNTLVFSTTVDNSYFAGVDQIRLDGGSLNDSITSNVFSEICCDTVSTVSRRVRYDRLNHNSAVNTGWTGAVTNINEIPTNDATPLYVAVTNQTSTFYENGLNLAGYSIVARGVSSRMRTQATNPPAIKLVIRAGTTNFLSARIAANAGYQASFNCWTSNPHTSALWTATNASSVENGVYSSG
jgi:hypothetical protein